MTTVSVTLKDMLGLTYKIPVRTIRNVAAASSSAPHLTKITLADGDHIIHQGNPVAFLLRLAFAVRKATA